MFTLLAAAAGAAAMYFFDPQSGRRRRALVRDKFAWLRDEAGDVREAAEGRAEDLRNRTTGVMHETRSAVRDLTGGADGTRDRGDNEGDDEPNQASESNQTNQSNRPNQASDASDRAA